MREITAIKPSPDFESLLEQVEEGGVSLVARDGKSVPRITPEAAPRVDSTEARRAWAEIAIIND